MDFKKQSPTITDPFLQRELTNKQEKPRLVDSLPNAAPDGSQIYYRQARDIFKCDRVLGKWRCVKIYEDLDDASAEPLTTDEVLEIVRAAPGIPRPLDARWVDAPPVIELFPNRQATDSFAAAFEARDQAVDRFIVETSLNQDGTGILPSGLQPVTFTIDAETEQITTDSTGVTTFGRFYYQIIAIVLEDGMPTRRASNRAEVQILNRVSPNIGTLSELTVYEGQRLLVDLPADFNLGTPVGTASIGIARNTDGDALDATDEAEIITLGDLTTIEDGQISVDMRTLTVSDHFNIFYQLRITPDEGADIVSGWTPLIIRNEVPVTFGTLIGAQLIEGETLSVEIGDIFNNGFPAVDFANIMAEISADDQGTTPVAVALQPFQAQYTAATMILTYNATNVDVSEDSSIWVLVFINQPTATEAQAEINT